MVEDLVGGAVFDDVAAVHHGDVVGDLVDHAQVVGDEDDGDAVALLQLPEQLEDGMLDGDVEGGGGLVGNQDVGVAGQRHGDHDALFLAAADFVGIAAEDAFGPWQLHLVEEVEGAPACCVEVMLAMGTHHLDHLGAAPLHRVEAGHGLLEDHRDVAAADVAEALFVEVEQVDGMVLAGEEGGAAADGGIGGEQPHQRQRADGFAAARLADDAEGASASKAVADVVDHLVSAEGDGQTGDL